MKNHVVVAPTALLSYFLYAWNAEEEPRWLARLDLAKRFTAREARRVAAQLNARTRRILNLIRVEKVA